MCIIRVFDAFSGIGGFRSGLERAGNFSFVRWCEIDKFAQKAYRTLYDVGDEDFHENIRFGIDFFRVKYYNNSVRKNLNFWRIR
ncbi:MAG: DNA cytosine methyltransferase [Oscillospiraceae bacterium]|nr:DNA cytosine methyltransferase [Oscillospiraceae bacterium]